MQVAMSVDEGVNVVPSTISWREPVEVGEVRTAHATTGRPPNESPRLPGLDSPAHGGHLSDGDTPSSAKLNSRNRVFRAGSPSNVLGGLKLSSSSPNLSIKDQDQGIALTETTQIIGIQAKLQEKTFGVGLGGVSDSFIMPAVLSDGNSPSSPQVSRQTIRSRARARKPDEPAPFLSVDNLPVDKVIVEGKIHSKTRLTTDNRKPSTIKKRLDPLLNGTGHKTRSPQQAFTPPMPRSPSKAQPRATPSATPYNYNSFFTHKSSAFLAGPPNLWSMGNKYWPQHSGSVVPATTPSDHHRQKLAPLPQSLAAETLAPKPNLQVSQPFKHDVDADVPVDRPVSPSQDLKERTIYALREVTRVLNRQQSSPPSRKGGKLLKGRLKPLQAFKLSGPTVEACRGIQPEDGDHTPGDSHMLQRKRELLSILPPDIFQQRSMTEESVHRTSVVSSLSVERATELEVGKIGANTDDQLSKSSQVLFGTRMPPNSLASLSEDNVSYLQDALTSHMDIQEGLGDVQPSGKEIMAVADENKVAEILEASATSREDAEIKDLGTEQVEEVNASGDASGALEKMEEEKESLAKDEGKATMSDYMNEGGAARVLSDMVQRVATSAKKSTVGNEGDTGSDQKYDGYFADSETRSETPTSRTGSSTLMRRRSSVDDMEVDRASSELTDLVSDDGLGEDGSSVKQRLSSLSEDKEMDSVSDDVATPTNKEYREVVLPIKDPNNNASLDKMGKENNRAENYDSVESTLHAYINSGLVEKEQNITSNFRVDQSHGVLHLETTELEETSKSRLNGISDVKTEHVHPHTAIEDVEQPRAGMTSSNAVPGTTLETHTWESLESDEKLPGRRELGESINSKVSVLKTNPQKASSEAAVDDVPTIWIESARSEGDSASEEMQDLMRQDGYAGISSDTVIDNRNPFHKSVENDLPIGIINGEPGTANVNSDDRSGERFESTGDENDLTKESESDNDDDDDEHSEKSSIHSNDFRKDDNDEGGNQGGQGGNSCHGNSSGSANGKEDGSTGNGENGNGNVQSEPPSGTKSSGAQRRHETMGNTNHITESGCLDKQQKLQSNRTGTDWNDLDDASIDEVPEIEEAVLFCGNCGLDEDLCLCPHSTFKERLDSGPKRSAIKSASVVEGRKATELDVSRRYVSAGGEAQRSFESWHQDAEKEEEWIQRHLVVEYQSLLEKPRHTGFLSEELTSLRFAEGVHMLVQGSGVKCESRHSEYDFRTHRTHQSEDRLMSDDINCQSEENVLSHDSTSDSGCWSEMNAEQHQNEDSVEQNATIANCVDSLHQLVASDEKVTSHQLRSAAESLVIVAKPLSKPKKPVFQLSSLPAPLCFRINAKPPPGFLYYFAYGADMNKNRMNSYIGREAEHRLWGVLFGFQLTFNKRGADLEAGRFPNIILCPESSVEGCVYLITQTELQKLNQHVGYPKFYAQAMFPVWMLNCDDPNQLGVAQYCVPALTYVAQDEWTLSQDEEQDVKSEYSVGQCLKGSDLLTSSYVQYLSGLRVH